MAGEQPWTVLRLITWTSGYLGKAGVEEPRLSAEVLLAHLLKCPRLNLYTQFDRAVAPEMLAEYKGLIQRAAGAEPNGRMPIAYLVGHREFYSLDLKVTPDVLIPRPETELLVDVVLQLAKTAPALKLWDVCTGSGCVALAAAKYAAKIAVLATDISPAAVAVAAENAKALHLETRVRLAQADLLTLPAEAEGMPPFDVITANPPYVAQGDFEKLPATVKAEPKLALLAGADGLEMVKRVIADAPAHLRPGGTLAMEIGQGQADAVFQLLQASGRYENIRFIKDLARIDRTAVAITK
jgi:release factor glutamine methyltransferase